MELCNTIQLFCKEPDISIIAGLLIAIIVEVAFLICLYIELKEK